MNAIEAAARAAYYYGLGMSFKEAVGIVRSEIAFPNCENSETHSNDLEWHHGDMTRQESSAKPKRAKMAWRVPKHGLGVLGRCAVGLSSKPGQDRPTPFISRAIGSASSRQVGNVPSLQEGRRSKAPVYGSRASAARVQRTHCPASRLKTKPRADKASPSSQGGADFDDSKKRREDDERAASS